MFLINFRKIIKSFQYEPSCSMRTYRRTERVKTNLRIFFVLARYSTQQNIIVFLFILLIYQFPKLIIKMGIYCITQVFVKSSFIEPRINHSNMELSTRRTDLISIATQRTLHTSTSKAWRSVSVKLKKLSDSNASDGQQCNVLIHIERLRLLPGGRQR